jgi:hypothetical protein
MTVIALLAAASCRLPTAGDSGYSVTVSNGTSARVLFFVDNGNPQPGTAMTDGTALDPAAQSVAHWVIPDGPRDLRTAQVRALDARGVEVYCHRFDFAELSTIRFHIVLSPGINDCAK